jgi:hypothetical protein
VKKNGYQKKQALGRAFSMGTAEAGQLAGGVLSQISDAMAGPKRKAPRARALPQSMQQSEEPTQSNIDQN